MRESWISNAEDITQAIRNNSTSEKIEKFQYLLEELFKRIKNDIKAISQNYFLPKM